MRRSAILQLALEPRHWRELAVLMGLMLVSAFSEGAGLLLLVPMLDALGSGSGDDNPVSRILASLGVPMSLGWLLMLFVALVAVRAIVNYARRVQAHRFEVSLVDGLRDRAWRALLHSDWRFLAAQRRSDHASLLISNIERVGYGVHEALNGIAILVTLAGVGLAALAISPLLAISAAGVGIVVHLAYRRVRRRAAQVGEELNRAHGEVHGRLGEDLGALRVIKSFGNEDAAAERSASAFARLRRAQYAYIHVSGLAQGALQIAGALLLALLVWVAIGQWQAGPTEILPLVALFARALPLLGALQQSWQEWAHAKPAIAATSELIEAAKAHREPTGSPDVQAPDLGEALVLNGVRVAFADRGRAALAGIDLELPAFSVTAVTGPSGAGKSTLADIVGGLVAPDSGQVWVDGVPIEGAMQRAWRERVTYVQQEPVLFTGTIRENLLWATPGASDSELEMALHRAAAAFAYDLPERLETRIGDGGRLLSGGERQRLVLARALLRDPRLLILDEASGALDNENERMIADAIAELRSRMTVLIISHRGELSAIADRTIRLDNGRIESVQDRDETAGS